MGESPCAGWLLLGRKRQRRGSKSPRSAGCLSSHQNQELLIAVLRQLAAITDNLQHGRGMFSRMRRIVVHGALMAGAALMLGACAADSHSPLPEFMRASASTPLPPEPQPDVKQMVRDKLDSVFVPTSQPRGVQVSAPHRDVRGPGWTACVKAELTSSTGKPLGTQTYRITIEDSMIVDRRRVEAEDDCASESYEPI
jgi:hypothetical protein